MKGFNFITIVLLFFICTSAQEFCFSNGEEYLAYAEVMPQPVGGIKAIFEKVEYPVLARQKGIQGRVFVMAFVDEDGSVADAKIIRGLGHGCDEAAILAVKSVEFTPGKNNNVPVKVKYSIPITFKFN